MCRPQQNEATPVSLMQMTQSLMTPHPQSYTSRHNHRKSDENEGNEEHPTARATKDSRRNDSTTFAEITSHHLKHNTKDAKKNGTFSYDRSGVTREGWGNVANNRYKEIQDSLESTGMLQTRYKNTSRETAEESDWSTEDSERSYTNDRNLEEEVPKPDQMGENCQAG